ncbi:hypothetical protein VTJ49DRAFT_419 [Mycothermus thermophilus]|uniref:DUF8035 domain-containing protein n=1 Tax=Humicola insolens TaxID=85995 RepID=A0ABR3VGE8_HUMIN
MSRWDPDRDRYEYDRERILEKERERDDDRYARRYPHFDDDDRSDHVLRESERRHVVYRGSSPGPIRRRAPSPPGRSQADDEVERSRVTFERERYRSPSPAPLRRRARSPPAEMERSRVTVEKERHRSRSPPPRLIRRQSSLDTFDRHPPRRYLDPEDRAYSPPPLTPAPGLATRRERIEHRDRFRDPRVSPYTYADPPPPRPPAPPAPVMSGGLHPVFRDARDRDREYYGEMQLANKERYEEDELHAYARRVRDEQLGRTTVETVRRTRSRSRERTSVRRRERSSSSSSRSSSSSSSSGESEGRSSVLERKDEYPKKGKTKIPRKMVSKRALRELGYPFVEEGNTIIVQLALGQQNIEDLVKLSAEYKKINEPTTIRYHSSTVGGHVLAEVDRSERRTEVYDHSPAYYDRPQIITSGPPVPYTPPTTITTTSSSGTGPIIIQTGPPPPPPRPSPFPVLAINIIFVDHQSSNTAQRPA